MGLERQLEELMIEEVTYQNCFESDPTSKDFYLSGKKALFHPNRVSFLGAGLTIGGLGAMIIDSPYAAGFGLSLISLGLIADGLDGWIARRYNLQSVEGSKLDPFFDKVKNFGAGITILGNETYQYIQHQNIVDSSILPFLATSYVASVIVDYISQKERGPVRKQIKDFTKVVLFPQKSKKDMGLNSSTRANSSGKWKTAIQSIVAGTYFTKEAIVNHIELPEKLLPFLEYGVNSAATVALGFATYLGYKGIMQKRILKEKGY